MTIEIVHHPQKSSSKQIHDWLSSNDALWNAHTSRDIMMIWLLQDHIMIPPSHQIHCF